jgi:hypothetical protein
MALSDIVNVVISSSPQVPTQAGFGVPLIADYHTRWIDRVRTYSSLPGMLADGFLVTDAAYIAAAALCSQSPRPPKFKVGRRSSAPTMSFTVTPVVANLTKYSLIVDGAQVDFTSSGAATAAAITAGLKGLIDALALPLTVTTPGNTSVNIVANAAGAWHQVAVLDSQFAVMSMAQDQADPGVSADLAAIALSDNDWYALAMTTASKAEVLAAAGWAETASKIYLAASQDTAIIQVVDSTPATDVAHALKAASRFRTAVIFHPDNRQFAGVAWLGAVLPLNPGSETWKFKALSGVAAVALTDTHIVNARAKNANFYASVAGDSITEDGKVSSGEWIDVVRFRDWLVARIGEAVLGLLLASSKVPYTDKGIGLIASQVRAVLKRGVEVGGLAEDPAFVLFVPKAADASPADKAARVLNGLGFTATLAGAIHATTINGTITA